jgi:hypothetical protein
MFFRWRQCAAHGQDGFFAPGGADGQPSGTRKNMRDFLGGGDVAAWKRGTGDADHL